MIERSVGWCGTLSERVLEREAVAFSPADVQQQSELFAHRAALFYTPTSSIPNEFIGSGSIDIALPIVTADYTETLELRIPTSPRFWVDLIQRQTMTIRWQPHTKAKVRFTRYDYYKIREDHFIFGLKALLDALKERTSGRSDGACLYYFGAIKDDSPTYVELEIDQQCIDHPSKARTRIQIDPI